MGVSPFRLGTLLNKRLQHKCFLVNIARYSTILKKLMKRNWNKMLVFITCPLALYCFVCMYAKARYKCLIFGLSSCYSPVLSREGGLDEGLSSIFVHIVTNIYSKIKTDFYFAFSSLTLQAFTMIYFSYFSYFNYFS